MIYYNYMQFLYSHRNVYKMQKVQDTFSVASLSLKYIFLMYSNIRVFKRNVFWRRIFPLSIFCAFSGNRLRYCRTSKIKSLKKNDLTSKRVDPKEVGR